MKNSTIETIDFILRLFIILALSVLVFLTIQYNTLDRHESSPEVLKIENKNIISIDTITTYECMPNDLNSLKEIKTIKVVYK